MQPEKGPQGPQQPEQPVSQSTPYATEPLQNPVQTGSQPVVTLRPDAQPQEQQLASDVPEDEIEPMQEESFDPEPVRWQAHEYIHHEKGFGWFFLFSLVVIALIALALFVMQSLSFAILIPVMAAALVVYTHRPPRVLDYTLSRQGLHVNDKLYAFNEFKSFGVIHDDGEYSIMLVPVKRFRAGLTVYFPEEAGEAIVDMLGARLPMQELHLDLIDRLIRKLRI
ncbi:MAG TPA: hypothetical protein VIQ80_00765 [Candidatus Saccharimonadales bacterium]